MNRYIAYLSFFAFAVTPLFMKRLITLVVFLSAAPATHAAKTTEASTEEAIFGDKRCVISSNDGVLPTEGPYVVRCNVDPTKDNPTYRLKVAPLVATTVQLPEAWRGKVSCGNCFFEGSEANKKALFRISLDEPNNRFIFKPNRQPPRDPRTLEVAPIVYKEWGTNVGLVLESGVTISIHFGFADQKRAASTVHMVLPEGSTKSGIREEIRKELLAEASERCDRTQDKGKLEQALVGDTICRTFSGRPNRKGPVVIRMGQLCRDPKYLWATFSVENAQRKQVQIESAFLVADDAATTASLFEVYNLEHRQRTKGVVSAPADSLPSTTAEYTLQIQPAGGEGTEPIELTGIRFE